MPAPRRFDHDDARARYEAGAAIADLAREYGVSHNSVWTVVTPGAQERAAKRERKRRTAVCEDCGGWAMALVGSKAKHNPDGRVLCSSCRSKTRRERLRFDADADGVLVAVRCCTFDCATGERWQPPGNFPRGTRFRDVREGGIREHCRACATRARRLYRERRKVPCVQCGQPRLADSETRAGRGICLRCYRKRSAA